jgi:hypothetical protein
MDDVYYLCLAKLDRSRATLLATALEHDINRRTFKRLKRWLKEVLANSSTSLIWVPYAGQQGENGKSSLYQRNNTDATACKNLDPTDEEDVKNTWLHPIACAAAGVTSENTAIMSNIQGRFFYVRQSSAKFTFVSDPRLVRYHCYL